MIAHAKVGSLMIAHANNQARKHSTIVWQPHIRGSWPIERIVANSGASHNKHGHDGVVD